MNSKSIEFIIDRELKFGDIFIIDGDEYVFISYAIINNRGTRAYLMYNYVFAVKYNKERIYNNINIVYINNESHKYEYTDRKDKSFLVKLQLFGVDLYDNSVELEPLTYEEYKIMVDLLYKVNYLYSKIDSIKACKLKDGKEFILLGLKTLAFNMVEVLDVEVVLYDINEKKEHIVTMQEIDNINKLSLIKRRRYKKIAERNKVRYWPFRYCLLDNI